MALRAELQAWVMKHAERILLTLVLLVMIQTCIYTRETRSLAEQQAGIARDPLVAEWVAASGPHIVVTVSREWPETDEAWEARFDDRVARRLLKYPKVKDTR